MIYFSRKKISITAALILLLLAPLSCAQSDSPPHLILITLDTCRADHLGCYGYFRNTSPNLDSLAEQSVFFERCYSPVSSTLPSHVTMLSGTYPIEHGVDHIIQRKKILSWPDGLTSVSEVLLSEGYTTAAFVSATPLSRPTGIDRGFSVYDEPDREKRSAEETNEQVFAWLDTLDRDPIFLWVHYFDPHGPHVAPGSFSQLYQTDERLDSLLTKAGIPEVLQGTATANLMNQYDGQIRYMDDQIGMFLARLRAKLEWDRTVVVVIGDHGEGLGQHGWFAHGRVWHEQLHVPAFIRAPGRGPDRVAGVLTTADIVPTLAALAPGLPLEGIEHQLSGRNILARKGRTAGEAFGQARIPPSDPAAPYNYIYALTTKEWRYTLSTADKLESLYHLPTDPLERTDIAADSTETVRKLRATLLDRIQTMEGRAAVVRNETGPQTRDPSARHLEQLRSLGYID